MPVWTQPAATPLAAADSALPAGIPWWVPIAALLLVMVLAFGGLLVYGWPSAKNDKRANNSVVRAWIAVSLIAALLILAGVTLGGTDSNLRNVLIGGIVAAASTAVAFYFATKANEATNENILKAAGIDGSAAAKPPLALSQVAVPALSKPPAAGDTIAFHFKVTNNGTETLTDVDLTDSLQPPSAITAVWPTPATPGVLKAGEAMTASATYTVTEADRQAKTVASRTFATGMPPSGKQIVSAPEVFTTSLV
ncbi:DUF7507 domain-containing protein [Leifsonia sp. McL0607]|uniref:DUF7507 domain-containing protein n=1 Tax=Leifsonia sp. McL0607 TaxID=3415672 RepID=UPI003CF81BA7